MPGPLQLVSYHKQEWFDWRLIDLPTSSALHAFSSHTNHSLRLSNRFPYQQIIGWLNLHVRGTRSVRKVLVRGEYNHPGKSKFNTLAWVKDGRQYSLWDFCSPRTCLTSPATTFGALHARWQRRKLLHLRLSSSTTGSKETWNTKARR